MEYLTNQAGSLEFVNGGTFVRHLVTLSNALKYPAFLVCPADAKRMPAPDFASGQRGNLSYFLGLEATQSQPLTMLAGDRNMTSNGVEVSPGVLVLTTSLVMGWTPEMHNLQGNVALSDGSVQQVNGPRITELVRGIGLATNRLAVP